MTNNIISDEWITSNIWYDISWYNRKDVLCGVGYHLWPANSAENPISPPYSFILASALHFSIIRLSIAGLWLLEARVKKWERKVKVGKLKSKSESETSESGKSEEETQKRMWKSESEKVKVKQVKVKRWKWKKLMWKGESKKHPNILPTVQKVSQPIQARRKVDRYMCEWFLPSPFIHHLRARAERTHHRETRSKLGRCVCLC